MTTLLILDTNLIMIMYDAQVRDMHQEGVQICQKKRNEIYHGLNEGMLMLSSVYSLTVSQKLL